MAIGPSFSEMGTCLILFEGHGVAFLQTLKPMVLVCSTGTATAAQETMLSSLEGEIIWETGTGYILSVS
jgi:hypothetical protein